MKNTPRNINLKIISFIFACLELQRNEKERASDNLQDIPEIFDVRWPGTWYEQPHGLEALVDYFPGVEQTIRQQLSYMEKLGMIQRDDEAAPFPDWPLNGWRLSNAEELGRQIQERDGNEPGSDDAQQGDRDRDTGNGGRRGGGNDDDDGAGDGPGDGPGGVRQVLGHPVLFALPEEEFDEVITRIFSGAGAS